MKVRHEQDTGFNPAARRGLGRPVKAALIASLALTILGAGGGQALAKENENCVNGYITVEGTRYGCDEITVTAPPISVPTPPPMPGGGEGGRGGGGGGGGGSIRDRCGDDQTCIRRAGAAACLNVQSCLDAMWRAQEEAERKAQEEAERKAQEEAARKAEEEALQKRLAAIRKALDQDYPACLAQVERWKTGEDGYYSCTQAAGILCTYFPSDPLTAAARDACKRVVDSACDPALGHAARVNAAYCAEVRDCIFEGGGSYWCRMIADWGKFFRGGSYGDPWPDDTFEEIPNKRERYGG